MVLIDVEERLGDSVREATLWEREREDETCRTAGIILVAAQKRKDDMTKKQNWWGNRWNSASQNWNTVLKTLEQGTQQMKQN